YPDDKALQTRALQFENDWMYTRLVNEGDRYFYQVKDYAKAAENYAKALDLREDMVIRDRLDTCAELLSESAPSKPVPKPAPKPVPPKPSKEKKKEKKEEEGDIYRTVLPNPIDGNDDHKKKSPVKAIISFVAIFLAVAVGFILFH